MRRYCVAIITDLYLNLRRAVRSLSVTHKQNDFHELIKFRVSAGSQRGKLLWKLQHRRILDPLNKFAFYYREALQKRDNWVALSSSAEASRKTLLSVPFWVTDDTDDNFVLFLLPSANFPFVLGWTWWLFIYKREKFPQKPSSFFLKSFSNYIFFNYILWVCNNYNWRN